MAALSANCLVFLVPGGVGILSSLSIYLAVTAGALFQIMLLLHLE